MQSQNKNSTSNELQTSVTLINLLKDSRKSDWTRFYEIYRGVVIGMARSYGLREQTTYDVLQDVMLAVSNASQNFFYDRQNRNFIANRNKATDNQQQGGFRQWFFTVVKRAIWKQSRKQNGREILFADVAPHSSNEINPVHQIPDTGPSPSQELEARSEQAFKISVLEQALRIFPECTKGHPRRLAIFLFLKQPSIIEGILSAKESSLPKPYLNEILALTSRAKPNAVTKEDIKKHYSMGDNHIDKEVSAVKAKLIAIVADLMSGRDPRKAHAEQ